MKTNHVLRGLAAFCLFLLSSESILGQEMPITTSSSEARDLFLRGRDKWENVEFPSAAQLFDQATAKDPNFALAYAYRAQAGGGSAAVKSNIEKALSLVEKSSPGERHYILAVKANVDGDRMGYKDHINELLRMFPKDKRSYFYLAFHYGGVDDTETIRLFQKALEFDKSFAAAYNYLGYAYIRLKNNKEAEKAFQQYIAAAPSLPNPRDSYAELLLRTGRFDESIVQYQKAYDLDNSFTGALGGIGFNYIHKGDFGKARDSFEKQNEKSPQATGKLGALANIMFSYLHEWKIEEAMKAADRYKEFAEKENLASNVVTYYIFSGWINLESGNASEARKHFQKAKMLNETTAMTAGTRGSNEVGIGIGQCAVLGRIKDFDGAKKQLEQCKSMVERRKNPFEERVLQRTMGELEREQGNYEKALQHFSMADPNDPFNIFSTAMAYEQKGDKENATKMYKQVVNWNWTGFPYALVRARAMNKVKL